MRLYTIYDNVALEAGPLFPAKNDGVAWRQFQQLLAETYNKEDYSLLYCGDFDTDSAVIAPCDPAKTIQAPNVDDEIEEGV